MKINHYNNKKRSCNRKQRSRTKNRNIIHLKQLYEKFIDEIIKLDKPLKKIDAEIEYLQTKRMQYESSIRPQKEPLVMTCKTLFLFQKIIESRFDYIIFLKTDHHFLIDWLVWFYDDNRNQSKIPAELNDHLYQWMVEHFKKPISYSIKIGYKSGRYVDPCSDRKLKFCEVSDCILENGENLGSISLYPSDHDRYEILDREDIDNIALPCVKNYIEVYGGSDGSWDVAEIPLEGYCLERLMKNKV